MCEPCSSKDVVWHSRVEADPSQQARPHRIRHHLQKLMYYLIIIYYRYYLILLSELQAGELRLWATCRPIKFQEEQASRLLELFPSALHGVFLSG